MIIEITHDFVENIMFENYINYGSYQYYLQKYLDRRVVIKYFFGATTVDTSHFF